MNCDICGRDIRPLIRAKIRFTKYHLRYDMVVWACLDCIEKEREKET